MNELLDIFQTSLAQVRHQRSEEGFVLAMGGLANTFQLSCKAAKNNPELQQNLVGAAADFAVELASGSNARFIRSGLWVENTHGAVNQLCDELKKVQATIPVPEDFADRLAVAAAKLSANRGGELYNETIGCISRAIVKRANEFECA